MSYENDIIKQHSKQYNLKTGQAGALENNLNIESEQREKDIKNGKKVKPYWKYLLDWE